MQIQKIPKLRLALYQAKVHRTTFLSQILVALQFDIIDLYDNYIRRRIHIKCDEINMKLEKKLMYFNIWL